MSQVYLNNYSARLVNDITESQTSFDVDTTLPSLGAEEYYLLTIADRAGEHEPEIIKVTSVIGNTINAAVRGQENTVAQMWGATTPIEMRITAGFLANAHTDLSVSRTDTSVTVKSSNGENATLLSASTTEAGLMSAADKQLLSVSGDQLIGTTVAIPQYSNLYSNPPAGWIAHNNEVVVSLKDYPKMLIGHPKAFLGADVVGYGRPLNEPTEYFRIVRDLYNGTLAKIEYSTGTLPNATMDLQFTELYPDTYPTPWIFNISVSDATRAIYPQTDISHADNQSNVVALDDYRILLGYESTTGNKVGIWDCRTGSLIQSIDASWVTHYSNFDLAGSGTGVIAIKGKLYKWDGAQYAYLVDVPDESLGGVRTHTRTYLWNNRLCTAWRDASANANKSFVFFYEYDGNTGFSLIKGHECKGYISNATHIVAFACTERLLCYVSCTSSGNYKYWVIEDTQNDTAFTGTFFQGGIPCCFSLASDNNALFTTIGSNYVKQLNITNNGEFIERSEYISSAVQSQGYAKPAGTHIKGLGRGGILLQSTVGSKLIEPGAVLPNALDGVAGVVNLSKVE